MKNSFHICLSFLKFFLTIFLFNILQVSFDWLSCWEGILGSVKQNPGGGYSPKIRVGVCGTLQETHTLLQTKICDFSYYISEQTAPCRNYFGWPKILTRDLKFQAFINCTSQEVHNNNDRNSFHQKLLTRFTGVHKPYSISGQYGSKIIPFGAAHTFIAYTGEYLTSTFSTLWKLKAKGPYLEYGKLNERVS